MKNLIFGLVVAASTPAFVQVKSSLAEDNDRPSRTASDGSQVVDYLAELETQVDSLERQVSALQNEIAHKNDLLSRQERPIVQREINTAAQLSTLSADLRAARAQITEQSERISGQQIQLSEKDQKIAKLMTATKAENRALTSKEGELQSKILKLESEIAEYRQSRDQLTRVADNEQKLLRSKADLEAIIASQRDALDRQQSYSKGLEEKLKQQAKTFEQQLALVSQAKSQQGVLEARIVAVSARERDLQMKVAELSEENQKERKRNGELIADQERERKGFEQQLVSLSTRKREAENQLARQQVASIAPSPSREVRLRMVPSERSAEVELRQTVTKMRVELDSMKANYQRRERLFSEYRSSRRSLLVNPVKAVSQRGESLNDLEMALKELKDTREAAQIKRSIEEIKRILDSDIRLIERLTRK
jgi:predicted  nucleic acid-binding Zn-ribbon protein